MDSEEYNKTICANCNEVKFEGYALVLITDQFCIDGEIIGTPLQCLNVALDSKLVGEINIDNSYGNWFCKDVSITNGLM